MKEEFDELWDEVKRNDHDYHDAYHEARTWLVLQSDS